MTPQELKDYYKTGYNFYKKTGMSQGSFCNWKRQGYIPLSSQVKIYKLTEGKLKLTFDEL